MDYQKLTHSGGGIHSHVLLVTRFSITYNSLQLQLFKQINNDKP